jgi:general secretion pathway protein G
MKKPIHKPGFTLIEMITVMTIIALLAGIVVGSAGIIQGRQAREKAKAQIALLSKAIEEYKMDMGVFPGDDDTAESGDVSEDLYQALFKDGYDFTSPATPPDPWDKARKIYVTQLDPRENKQGWVKKIGASDTVPVDLKILDPWGNPYRYRRGTNAQNPDFDLWSTGKDGLTQTGNTDAQLKHKDNRDDIRNF